MLNTLKLHFSQNKSLLIATIISLLLHTFFLTEFALTLPEVNEDHQALEMRLVNLPPTQKTAPVPIPEPEPKQKPDVETTSQEDVQAANSQDINPAAEIPIQQESMPAETLQNTPEIDQTATEIPFGAITETADATELGNIAKPSIAEVYRYIETEFEIRRGSDVSAAGVARIVFAMSENNTYTLNSVTEAKGLVSLFMNNLVQKSDGIVTDKGLVPNYYSYQYGNDKNKIQSAAFAWSDGVIVMRSAKGEKIEPLATGTQDFLSFMYQFMFSPPLESMQITMTNGKQLRTYTYSFAGEEIITTKIGDLNTIHLLKQGDKEEKTELWLAADYQNLPVKIRKTEKDGSVIEQTAIKISTIAP